MTKKITIAISLAAALIALGASPALGQVATLTCTPSVSSIPVNTPVSFFFSGGNGTFTVSGNGIATTTANTVLTTSFSAPGTGTLVLSSAGQSVNCNVAVTAATTGAVACMPPSGNITVGEPAVFTATGGNGTFTWSATDITVSNPVGTSFTATYNTPGVHTVTVVSNGTSASCSVNILAATTGALMCSPAAQTAIVGQAVHFTATGGTGSYVWSATDLTLTNPVGSGFTATYGTVGTHTVTVTSGAATASCLVTVTAATTTPPPGLPNTGYPPAGY